MSTLTSTYQLHRAGPRFGAEITGIDLTQDLDEVTTESLRRAFVDHKVLVFRGQHLSPAEHVEAVRIFGEPFDHPTAVRDARNRFVYPYDVRETGKGASTWHVGGLWREPPFSIESLTYIAVSEFGGNTLWADLQAAYDDLSEPVRALLEGVSGVYDANADNYAQGSRKVPIRETIEHPVVYVHPDTGRRGLFLSSSARGLTGLKPAEGDAVLRFLLAHASSPNYTIRFSWAPGDFVLWDNRATWHFAVDDYGDEPRVYRKVIATREHLPAGRALHAVPTTEPATEPAAGSAPRD